jgi:predicted transcriptional regulator
MATETDTFRLGKDTKKKLAAWALLLEKDKTAIIREAISQWEQSQSEANKKKVETILKELQ